MQTEFDQWLDYSLTRQSRSLQLFSRFDTGCIGTVDVLQVLSSLAILSDATVDERCRFIFELFDFNLNGSLSLYETVLMCRSMIVGCCKVLCCNRTMWPTDEDVLSLVQQGFSRYDGDKSKTLSYSEFIAWANGNHVMRQYIEVFSLKAPVDISQLSVREYDINRSPGTQYDGESDTSSDTASVCSLTSVLYCAATQEEEEHSDDDGGSPVFPIDASLELIGCIGSTFSSGVQYTSQGIVYVSDKLVVGLERDEESKLYNTAKPTLFTQHTSTVQSISSHPSHTIIASSDRTNVFIHEVSPIKSTSSNNSTQYTNHPSPKKLSNLGRKKSKVQLSSRHQNKSDNETSVVACNTLNEQKDRRVCWSDDGDLLLTVGSGIYAMLNVWDWRNSTILGKCPFFVLFLTTHVKVLQGCQVATTYLYNTPVAKLQYCLHKR